MMIKRISTGVLIALGMLSIGLRIYGVNSETVLPETITYAEREIVPFENDFFWQEKENSSGYEVCVLSSYIKEYSEYMSELGETENYLDEGYRPDFIYVLEVLVKNTNTDEEVGRGFDFIDMRVQAINETLQVNLRLFELLYPDLGAVDGFRIRPGTEKVMTLPYTRSYAQNGFETLDEMKSKQFYLLLSMFPHKKMILLD